MSANDANALPPDFARAFKPADIRGVYPTEINEELAYRAARAFVTLYKLSALVVGRDMRASSDALHDAFVRGALDEGASVTDLGLVDTPAVYFASGSYQRYGVMITASHNPKEYNGFKLVKSGAIPLTDTDGLDAIQTLVAQNAFPEPQNTGTVEKKDIWEEYKTYLHSLVHIPQGKKVRVVVDAGNGMATLLAPIICSGFPIDLHPLFFGLDGAFPNRGSDPTVEKNLGPIHAEMRRALPDFGVAFDGDVDRAAFLDETGARVNSSAVGALIAKRILQKAASPGTKIVYTNFTSRSYTEAIRKYGGAPVRAKVGHSLIKNTMRREDAAFACELSAHFYFKDNFYTDSGILAFLSALSAYTDPANEGKKFSELVAEFNTYRQTEEMLVPVKDREAVLRSCEEHYRSARPEHLDTFDGLHVEFPEYWFTLAASITEDGLKLVVEARDEKTLAEKRDEILSRVRADDASPRV